MATKIWMARGTVADTDQLAEQANKFLADIEARGGRFRDTHTAITDYGGRAIVLLTLVYEDATTDYPVPSPA